MPVEVNLLWTLLTNLLSGLVGAGVGLAGARWFEERRERRQKAAALAAVLHEMGLLGSTLEYAADGKRMRRVLTKVYWDRFGPDLVNYLPLPLFKLMFVLYEDDFYMIQEAYARITSEQGVPGDEAGFIKMKFESTAFATKWIQDRINEHFEGGKKRVIQQPSEFSRLVQRLDVDTRKYLQGKGYSIPQDLNLHDPNFPLG